MSEQSNTRSFTAKAVVSNKQEWGSGDSRSTALTLSADYQDGANKEWASATPSFQVSTTVKATIGDQINLGDKVDVLLTFRDPEAVPEVSTPVNPDGMTEE